MSREIMGNIDWLLGELSCEIDGYYAPNKTIEKLNEQIQQLLSWTVECVAKLRLEYIEEMAAAYFLKTDIDPREVELVEDHRGTEIVFYFRRKENRNV